jgi:hypothetical protein
LKQPVYFENLVEGYVNESAEVIADRDDMVAYAERNDRTPYMSMNSSQRRLRSVAWSLLSATRCRCTSA